MIKYATLLLFLVQSYVSSSQSIMVGAGGIYGTDIEQVGVNARVYYGLNEQICFGPEFSYFPKVTHGSESIQLNEYGFVVHYIFEIKEEVGLYPLLGINYSVEESEYLGYTHTNKAMGAAIGAGMHLEVKNFMPFIEYKYIMGELSQSTFSLGVIYNFKFTE